VFFSNPFFQPSKNNFCSSENSMLLPCHAAPRLSKRLTADLSSRLEDGLLKNGYTLFGNNGYLNSSCKATPYANVLGNPNKKSKDNYNFLHLQLRIRVECSFGMLVARWGILQMVLSN
jgi:hypothetical protein